MPTARMPPKPIVGELLLVPHRHRQAVLGRKGNRGVGEGGRVHVERGSVDKVARAVDRLRDDGPAVNGDVRGTCDEPIRAVEGRGQTCKR